MASSNRKSCSIDKDIYDRLKRDSKFKKQDLDDALNTFLRKHLFTKDKKNSGKGDFKGYCPNCSGVIKNSTLKSKPEKKGDQDRDVKISFWKKYFS